MLNGEELQLSQDSSVEPDTTSVAPQAHFTVTVTDLNKSSYSSDPILKFSTSLTNFDDIRVSILSSFIPDVPLPSSISTSDLDSSIPLNFTSDLIPQQSSVSVLPDRVTSTSFESSLSESQTSFPSHPPVVSYPSPQTNTHSMTTRSKAGIYKPKHMFALSTVSSSEPLPEREPAHFTTAIKSAEWQQAMATEYKALVDQNTWTLVPSPSHGNIIGCQWIYNIKRHSD
ncbi:hypothetical protein Vadar_007413 [Vaccinium darrowii]|uniref:Uncharacterized protein n=1 Tax=Vaccinium darrowii TaxID=229202 RepID=A0ACB7YC25_9ERIC|nr:hypothetical protein Vadar_007413 [Vaccinium darrowii]